MAFTPNSNLTRTGPTILRDYAHAANLFNVDQFRLAPKFNFQFHVSFGINTGALKNSKLVSSYGQEINMLVKSIDLPNFAIATETLNQYNRKKIVQYRVNYQEIGAKFHDDNMGLINQVWQEYFSYYYADSNTATIPGAYSRNATKAFSSIPSTYGFDASSITGEPFFSYIKIYQMARHEYVCYHLYNPVITSWNHNKLDYSQNQMHDFDMKFSYESVSYSVGNVGQDQPEGFGVTHYDNTPSPLKGSRPNGVTSPSFVSSTGAASGGVLSNTIAQINTYQNTQLSSKPISKLASGLATGLGVVGLLGAASSLVSGLSGFSFPSFGSKNTDDVSNPGSSGTENEVLGENPGEEVDDSGALLSNPDGFEGAGEEAREVDTGADTYDPETDFRTEEFDDSGSLLSNTDGFEEYGGSDDEGDGW